jgi:hypothetical protein
MTGAGQPIDGPAGGEPDFEPFRRDALGHLPHLVSREEIEQKVHGGGSLGRFNSRVAVLITNAVGTMWAAYVFAFIALVSLPAALTAFQQGDTTTAIQWLSNSFLQLVLLPIIIVGQNVISTAQDKRAEHDHHTLTVLHRINVQQLKLLEQQQEILDRLGAAPAPGAKPA